MIGAITSGRTADLIGRKGVRTIPLCSWIAITLVIFSFDSAYFMEAGYENIGPYLHGRMACHLLCKS